MSKKEIDPETASQIKKYIKRKLTDLSSKKNLQININEKLLNEVTDIVEKPKVIFCTFDKKYLSIPKEIIIITMEHHQKYFPIFDKKDNLTNNFFIPKHTVVCCFKLSFT